VTVSERFVSETIPKRFVGVGPSEAGPSPSGVARQLRYRQRLGCPDDEWPAPPPPMTGVIGEKCQNGE